MTCPYILKWDSVAYPPKFKPSTLHTYDVKSSPNQHIYYFWSQTGNVIDNDAIMARLFIATLKGQHLTGSEAFLQALSIPEST